MGRGCRTALFVTLGVMGAFVLLVGGLVGYGVATQLGAFDKYRSVPELNGTLVTDADVQSVLGSGGSPHCPGFPTSADEVEQQCIWGGEQPDGLRVDVTLYHGSFFKTGPMRAQSTYAYYRGQADAPTDRHGIGDVAFAGKSTLDDGDRVLGFIDGNLVVQLTYVPSARDGTVMALARALDSRLAKPGR
jgi:hypothetical protein